jgi:hypothetical protein
MNCIYQFYTYVCVNENYHGWLEAHYIFFFSAGKCLQESQQPGTHQE